MHHGREPRPCAACSAQVQSRARLRPSYTRRHHAHGEAQARGDARVRVQRVCERHEGDPHVASWAWGLPAWAMVPGGALWPARRRCRAKEVVPYSKWGPSITGARNDGNTRKGNQWKPLAPNFDWQQKHDRDSSKLARSGGRSTRSEVARNPKSGTRSEATVHTWRRAANSSLKRRMGHVGETVVTRGRGRTSDTQSRQNKGQDNGHATRQCT
ncbi:hypothetical protein JB92DRAFT_3099806 [Gautieria morchelliformis]|nr:hypothetical protein JB92DRAFT_3099806 [Gautieria morchelliformis]